MSTDRDTILKTVRESFLEMIESGEVVHDYDGGEFDGETGREIVTYQFRFTTDSDSAVKDFLKSLGIQGDYDEGPEEMLDRALAEENHT